MSENKPGLMAELAAYKRLCSTPGIDASFKYQAAASFMSHAELEAAVRDAGRLSWVGIRGFDNQAYSNSVLRRGGNGDLSDIREYIDQAMHNSAREG